MNHSLTPGNPPPAQNAETLPSLLGSAPAPGASTRRPRRVVVACAASLNGGSSRPDPNVAGEGASHGTRGGRAPLLQNSCGIDHSHRVRRQHAGALASVLLAFALCAAPAATGAQTNAAAAAVQLPMKAKLHLYLLMGQSNMAGRGKLAAEDQTSHPRVLMFTLANQWEPAVEPVTHDKPTLLGVGPGLAFGKAMAEHDPNITIGLVSCAFGGTPLKRWQRGGDLYSNAVHRAQLAMRDGTLKGILWHQGESDSGTSTNANSYGDRLAQMIKDIRADLGCPDLPFVAGQIGEFLYDRGPDHSPYARVVNAALAALPEKLPATGCASAKNLKHKGDQLHFDAASQRELGRRYAAEMIRLQDLR
jgi:hypothetical protein